MLGSVRAGSARSCHHLPRGNLSHQPPPPSHQLKLSRSAVSRALYLFIYFIYVPEDSCRSLRCSRALLFKVGLRYVSGATRAQFLTVNSGVVIPEIAPENSSAMPLEAKDCAIPFRAYCCIVRVYLSACALCMKVFCVTPRAMCSTVR